MNEPMVEEQADRIAAGHNRRGDKPDLWRKALNFLAYVVYPLLLINALVAMGSVGGDRQEALQAMKGQIVESWTDPMAHLDPATSGQPTTAQDVSVWIQLNAFLPIMGAGIAIGIAGIVLDRKRARRRSDSSLMGPLVLLVLSVAGLLLYLIIRAMQA